MAAPIAAADDDVISEINVTPLVDVMMVLLVIFMVTATFIVQPALPIQLPTARSGAATDPSAIDITLAMDGSMSLNGKACSLAALDTAVRAMTDTPAALPAVVSADARIPHGRVVEVLDALRTVGVAKACVRVQKAR